MNYDVFISHSRDNRLAKAVYEYLSRNRINCFLDSECLIPGELFPGHISEARESCSVVVLLLSRASDGSTAVNSEINNLYKKKKVIPVRIEEFEPRNLSVFVGALQWLDACSPPFEKHLPSILYAVRTHLKKDSPAAPETAESGPLPEDMIAYLKGYFADLGLNYPSFENEGERFTIGEHAIRVLRVFERYRVFNRMEYPESIMARDKFRIVLALHDIGMARVASRNNMKVKYDIARKSIQWIIGQPEFQQIYGFNAQEKQVALSLVSDEPIRRYLNGRAGDIACAEQITDMAARAGIEADGATLWQFFKLLTILYLCDAASYLKTGGTERPGPIFLDEAGKEVCLTGTERERFARLELTVSKISSGAVTFTSRGWKRVRAKHLNSFARGSTAKMRRGETVQDHSFQYRHVAGLSAYQVSPLEHTRLPALYEPEY